MVQNYLKCQIKRTFNFYYTYIVIHDIKRDCRCTDRQNRNEFREDTMMIKNTAYLYQ